MEHWLLGLLTFLFGYVTCRTFYFVKSARISLTLLRASHIVYISAILKALENLSYSREVMLEHMAISERGATEISLFEKRYEQDVDLITERSIQVLRALHPKFFETALEFENWSEAIKYAEENREIMLKFWEQK